DIHVRHGSAETEPGEGEGHERAEDAGEDLEHRSGGRACPLDGHGDGDVLLLQLGRRNAEQSHDRQVPVLDDLVGAVTRDVEERACQRVYDDVDHHHDDRGRCGDRQALAEDSGEGGDHPSPSPAAEGWRAVRSVPGPSPAAAITARDDGRMREGGDGKDGEEASARPHWYEYRTGFMGEVGSVLTRTLGGFAIGVLIAAIITIVTAMAVEDRSVSGVL